MNRMRESAAELIRIEEAHDLIEEGLVKDRNFLRNIYRYEHGSKVLKHSRSSMCKTHAGQVDA